MKYKGYDAKVVFDDDAMLLHGEVINTRDVITFQATSADDLLREFQFSVDEYLSFCKERGREPVKPYSGKFVLRIEPEFHRSIQLAASRADKSINTWVVDALTDKIRREIGPSVRSNSASTSSVVQVPFVSLTPDKPRSRFSEMAWGQGFAQKNSRTVYSPSDFEESEGVLVEADEDAIYSGH